MLDSKIAQKIGRATQDFKSLKQFWNHCYIPVKFKYIVFTACIIQRLLYSLEGAWLNKHLSRKLDGFYCKCLRQILKISPSFISRVSNNYILKQFHSKPLSMILLQRQLLLFGRIARMSNSAPMRHLVFLPHSLDLVKFSNRRQGRPRNSWASELHKHSLQIAGQNPLHSIILDEKTWKQRVCSYMTSSFDN